MQRKRRPGPNRSRRQKRSVEGRASVASALAGLEIQFARFRRRQPRGTRIPEVLRAAGLAAVGQGVRPGELQRSCGVTWSQVVRVRRVLLAEHRVDCRKGIHGLLGEAYRIGAQPYDGDCVVYIKKDRTQIRALVGDRLRPVPGEPPIRGGGAPALVAPARR